MKLKENYKKMFGNNLLRVIMSLLIIIMRSILLLVPPLILQIVLNMYNGYTVDENFIIISAVTIGLIPCVTGALIILELNVSDFILHHFAKLKVEVYDNLLVQTLNKIQSIKTAEFLEIFTRDIEKISLFYYQEIGVFIWLLSTILLGVFLMFLENMSLTSILLLLTSAHITWIIYLNKKRKTIIDSIFIKQAEQNTFFYDIFSIVEYIKGNSVESSIASKGKNLNDSVLENRIAFQRSEFKRNLVDGLVKGVGQVIILLLLGISIMDSKTGIGNLTAINAIYIWLIPAYIAIISVTIGLSDIKPLNGRLFSIYKKSNKKFISNKQEISCSSILLKNVVVKNIKEIEYPELYFEKGKRYFISGQSGVGKSTLLHVISRLNADYFGTIKIGGDNLSDIDELELRKKMLIIPQNARLLGKTLKENFRIIDDCISNEEIYLLLEKVGVLSSVLKLEIGIETDINELQRKLSGGEIQKIILTRIFQRKPEIIILDESTSSLDYLSEEKIIKQIEQEFCESMVIVCSHRKSRVFKDYIEIEIK